MAISATYTSDVEVAISATCTSDVEVAISATLTEVPGKFAWPTPSLNLSASFVAGSLFSSSIEKISVESN